MGKHHVQRSTIQQKTIDFNISDHESHIFHCDVLIMSYSIRNELLHLPMFIVILKNTQNDYFLSLLYFVNFH